MHIVFVNSTRKWGGVKTWTVDYATELVAHGHSVRVFGRQPEFIDALQARGIPAGAVNFGFDYNPLTIGRFLAAFIASRPDVVVCNITKDMNTAGIAATMLGIPVIQRVGLPGDMVPKPRLTFLLKTVRPWMLCPSQTVADGIFRLLPYVPCARVKVIANSKKPVDAIRPVQDRPLELISTSQVNPDKGHEDVLQALQSFPAGSFRYNVVGTGSVLKALKERYRELEERGDLVWHGFSTNIADHLGRADVFLLPSRSEGMPNALLEAMAAGLIPVSRDVGGVPEIWPDSLAEYLVPCTGDSQAFRGILEKLLEADSTELNGLKEASLRACRTTFNLQEKINEFEEWVNSDILGR